MTLRSEPHEGHVATWKVSRQLEKEQIPLSYIFRSSCLLQLSGIRKCFRLLLSLVRSLQDSTTFLSKVPKSSTFLIKKQQGQVLQSYSPSCLPKFHKNIIHSMSNTCYKAQQNGFRRELVHSTNFCDSLFSIAVISHHIKTSYTGKHFIWLLLSNGFR